MEWLTQFLDPHIERHLLRDEGEVLVDEVTRHWFAYARACTEVMVALALLVGSLFAPTRAVWVLLVLGMILLAHGAWLALRDARDRFVVTNMRVYRVHGVFSKQIATMPLSRSALARSRTQGFLRKFNLEGSRCMTTGTTEEAVATAITAILEGTESDVSSAFSTLAELDAAEVVGELFLWVEDVTEGVEVDRLIQTSRIQPPENARAIVEAIRARDMKGLERATSSNDLGVAINALIGVIVSFKDARTRM